MVTIVALGWCLQFAIFLSGYDGLRIASFVFVGLVFCDVYGLGVCCYWGGFCLFL